jgi:hypothetical protein
MVCWSSRHARSSATPPIRVVEILGGDPSWNASTVSANSLCRGEALHRVLNTQMIIDSPITEGDGGKSYLTISRPVLQRMVDGRTRGIALEPLGSISASFYASGEAGDGRGPRLRFDVED